MKVTLEDMAQPYLLRIIEEDPEAIREKTQAIWATKRDDMMMDGFRKGHVPQNIAEAKIGFAVLYDSYVNQIILDSIEKIRNENGKVVVDLQQVYPEKLGRDGIVMQAVAYLRPTVSVDYSNLQVEKKDATATPEEVDAQVDQLREAHALMVPITDRGVEFGDFVVMSFAGSINGVPFDGGTASRQRLQLQSTSFIAGFAEQLLGMKPEEQRTISVKFPDDYRATQVAGKDAQFDVSIHEISRKDLPAIDDDFAQLNDSPSVAELRQKHEVQIQSRKKEHARAETETLLVTQLLGRAEISPLPQTMIERYLNQMLQQQLNSLGMTEDQYFEKANSSREQFNQNYYHVAKRDIKVQLILDEISRKEDFAVTDEERQVYLTGEAARLGLPTADLEAMTTTEQIDSRVKMRKAYDMLLDRATYVEPEGKSVGQQ